MFIKGSATIFQFMSNNNALKIFLFLNICLFLYAISRLSFLSSQDGNPNEKPHISIQNNLQRLKSLDTIEPCDCGQSKRSIAHLQSKISLLEEDVQRHKMGVRICKTNHSSNNFHRPSKIGEDSIKSNEFQVPNIVHYIWYNENSVPLQFHHMLSILSADKFIKPDFIYFHTDNQPIGKYWERVKKLARLKIVSRKPPHQAFGETIKSPKFYTSHSNVDRILVLMEYGGIYLDFDFIALRSFDELRKHVCTVGFESEEKACGSVIVCSKESFFLYLWINAFFDDYRIDEWAYNSGQVPFNLAKRFPHLVNVEKSKLNRPNFQELSQIYVKATWWKWRENYGFHSWYRLWKDNYGGFFTGVEPDEHNIDTLDSPFGEIARAILND